MRHFAFCILIFFVTSLAAQKDYKDSLVGYQKEYVEKHEVVTGNDKQYLRFFPINEKYRVLARLESPANNKWFRMPTSGAISKTFRVYGILHFTINDTSLSLPIYQSQNLMNTEEYRNHLFLPFTDLGSGTVSYTTGRYIDLEITDIKNGYLVVDFNKAYNPYCAYVSGKYNCPIPPAENHLPVMIAAGEMAFKAE